MWSIQYLSVRSVTSVWRTVGSIHRDRPELVSFKEFEASAEMNNWKLGWVQRHQVCIWSPLQKFWISKIIQNLVRSVQNEASEKGMSSTTTWCTSAKQIVSQTPLNSTKLPSTIWDHCYIIYYFLLCLQFSMTTMLICGVFVLHRLIEFCAPGSTKLNSPKVGATKTQHAYIGPNPNPKNGQIPGMNFKEILPDLRAWFLQG